MCPSSRTLLLLDSSGEPYVHSFDCGSRNCIACGERWVQSRMADLRAALSPSAEIHVLICTTTEWASERRRLSRAASKAPHGDPGFLRIPLLNRQCLVLNDVGVGQRMKVDVALKAAAQALQNLASLPSSDRVRPSRGWANRIGRRSGRNHRSFQQLVALFRPLRPKTRRPCRSGVFQHSITPLSDGFTAEDIPRLAHLATKNARKRRGRSPTPWSDDGYQPKVWTGECFDRRI